MIKKILDRLFEEGQEFEKNNEMVPYNQLYSAFIIQSIIEAIRYYYEQDEGDRECIEECIFDNLYREGLEKVMSFNGNLLEHIRDSWFSFNHRDRYDICGLSEDEGWYGTYRTINQVFRYWM